ncbi:MAG: hypothetical protein Q9225_003053 [Loekoesia sp. 1 TL-2023]
MLILNPSPLGDSSAPPPYTLSSSIAAEASDLPIGSGLRGGDAQPPITANDPGFQSAAAYLQERPYNDQYPNNIRNHTLIFSPNTTRDDLPFPQPEDQYHSRDVSMEDWNTFVNYLLPIDVDSAGGKSRLGRPRSKDVLRDRDRIEAVLAEWHEGFFGPRGIRMEARFPATSHLDVSPPPPFTSTADVGFYPEVNPSTDQRAPMPPQPPMPSQPPMSYGSSFASVSSSDFSGVGADEVRRSIVTLRQNLNNRAHLSTAIRQFKNEIRQSRREHRDVSRGMRNMSREQKSQFKTQRKEMKAELKSLVKGARAMRKADRKVRKAERKSRRARRRAERRGMDAHDLSQKAVAKAEAKALKAQKRAIEATEKGMEAEERARVQEDEDMMQRDLAEGTRSLELNDTKKQESGVCAQNE